MTGFCDGYCDVDYVDVALERGFTIEAGAGRAPSTAEAPTAVAGDGAATVSWPAVADPGSGTGLGYTVVASRVGDPTAQDRSCQTTGLTCTVTGLTNLSDSDEPYVFRVRATTSVGTSGTSMPSNPVRPRPAQAPVYRPDLSVLSPSGAVGAGVVNATGTGQVLDVTVPAGTSTTVQLVLTNAGDTVDTYGLAEARGGQYAAFGRAWTRAGADITGDVAPEVGWHQVVGVAPGDARPLELRLDVPATTPAGTTATYAMHAYHSPASAGIQDVAVVRVTAAAAPVQPVVPPIVPPVVEPVPTVLPGPIAFDRLRYTGVLEVGRKLVARVRVEPAAGTRVAYRWLRGSRVITGATGRTYVLRRADRGQRIALRVVARATGHTTTTRTYRRPGRVR